MHLCILTLFPCDFCWRHQSTVICKIASKRKLYLIPVPSSQTHIHLFISQRKNPIVIFRWKMELFMFMPIRIQERFFLSLMLQSTSIFTDLHHLLTVIADGNIRTLCHLG